MQAAAQIELLTEYETVLSALGHDATDEQVIHALVSECGWTRDGAAIVLNLARSYGTSVLRNALAIATALGIEDGDRGM